MDSLAFPTAAALHLWLKEHHKSETSLWVRIYKKGSGVASLTWNDCVVVSLCWGWIDGQKKSLDEASYLQRITPRRPRSAWSKRNCALAEQLIADGSMQPAGLRQVNEARADGRWEAAYAGSADMRIPEDFLLELRKHKQAARAFEKLNRSSLFRIYYQLQSAKKPETRARRINAFISKLEEDGTC